MQSTSSDFPRLLLRIHTDLALGKSISLDGFESFAQRCEAEGRCSALPDARVQLRALTQDQIEGDLYWQRPDKSGEYVVSFSAPFRRRSTQ